MKKLYIKNLILLILFSIVCIDLSGLQEYGLNQLFYKVKPIFADLITIIPSIEELSKLDINSSKKISSTETMGRQMNYPLIWVYIFDFVGKFINPIFFFGCGQILFYFIFSYYVQKKVIDNNIFLILFLFLFSPPIILALERGNNDLTIFFLFIIGFFSSSFLRGLFLGIAIALKVYPIFLFIVYFLLKKINKSFLLGLLITSPLILFTLLQINIYIGNTSVSFSSSFGLLTMGLFFQKIISLLFQIDANKTVFIFLSLLIFFINLKIFDLHLNVEISKLLLKLSKNKKNFELFLLSSGLSIFIFFAFSNWAYRLVFLLPAVTIFIKEFNLNYHFLNFKNFLIFILITMPFLSTWILIPTKEILLNHYTWAFFGPITFFSFSFYFLILKEGIIIYRNNSRHQL